MTAGLGKDPRSRPVPSDPAADPRYKGLLAELGRAGRKDSTELARASGLKRGQAVYRLQLLLAAGAVVNEGGMWELAGEARDAAAVEDKQETFAARCHALAGEIRVQQAVAAWKRLLGAQRRVDQLTADLHEACAELSPEETAEYVQQTTEPEEPT